MTFCYLTKILSDCFIRDSKIWRWTLQFYRKWSWQGNVLCYWKEVLRKATNLRHLVCRIAHGRGGKPAVLYHTAVIRGMFWVSECTGFCLTWWLHWMGSIEASKKEPNYGTGHFNCSSCAIRKQVSNVFKRPLDYNFFLLNLSLG